MKSRFSLRDFSQLGILVAVVFLAHGYAMQRVSSSSMSSGVSTRTIDMRVKVVIDDHSQQPAVRELVTLLNTSGSTVDEIYTNEMGEVIFRNLATGSYKLRASGMDIETAQSPFSIDIDGTDHNHFEILRVSRKVAETSSAGALVSVAELSIPEPARKLYRAGEDAAMKNELDQARLHLQAAVDMYPKYAAAFNLLGLVEMNRHEPQAGINAFRNAIAADDKFTPAYLNLAKARMVQQRYPDAEDLLQKSLSIEPLDTTTMMYLANVYLYDGKYDQVTQLAIRAQSLPHKQSTSIHILAGMAYEQLKQSELALAEYKLYLQESPNGNLVKNAHEALDRITSAH